MGDITRMRHLAGATLLLTITLAAGCTASPPPGSTGPTDRGRPAPDATFNYILGSGTLSSRLGTRIRQREGLTYGVSSSFSASSFDKRASLTITAICNPQNVGRVEKAVQEELDRLLRDGVTQDELDKARTGYLQSQKVGRSSDTALAGILSNLSHAGRTMAFSAEFEKRIEALTPDQVLSALRKHIDPKKLVIVIAGDFETKASASGE